MEYNIRWELILTCSFCHFLLCTNALASVHLVLRCLFFYLQLFVPRCTGLTADGLVKIIHFLHGHKGNLSRVRLHGICKMTNHHLDVIKSLVCRGSQQQDAQALYYNHRVHEVLNTDDGCPIDVDVCPLCRNVRLVFDCTRRNCRSVPLNLLAAWLITGYIPFSLVIRNSPCSLLVELALLYLSSTLFVAPSMISGSH